MIRFITAGESHGKGLTAIVEGFPSNLKITSEYIDSQLKRRQAGYGRGMRMKIESDHSEILAGIRDEKTLGSPVSIFIENKDWLNWVEILSSGKINRKIEKVTIPRPGHTDMAGTQKYNYDDIRNTIERSSARETAARVAVCSVARRFLEEFDIHIGSFVESIGGIYPETNFADKLFKNKLGRVFNAYAMSVKADKSPVRVFDKNHENKIIKKIQSAKKKGDTLGGTFYIVASGVPAGLGSFVHYDRKLNADICHAIMSINAVKGVEIGMGFGTAEVFGSQVHDEITYKDNLLTRKTNRAGGIEGGVSTGLPVIVRGAMKPIATLMSPIYSVDLATMKNVKSRRERSDFVAVPACAVIAESMTAWIIAKHFIHKFGGDSLEETKDNYNNFKKINEKRLLINFTKSKK